MAAVSPDSWSANRADDGGEDHGDEVGGENTTLSNLFSEIIGEVAGCAHRVLRGRHKTDGGEYAIKKVPLLLTHVEHCLLYTSPSPRDRG